MATSITTHDWIDGMACPALAQSLYDLARVRVSGFAPPLDISPSYVSETPFIEVTGPPANAAGVGSRLKLGGFTGPIVDWWNQTETNLAGCWKTGSTMAG